MTSPLLSPLAWSAYVVVPAAGAGWLDGVPLGPVEAALLALVWWTWARDRALPGGRLLAVLAIAKVALGAGLVDRGFDARYYANERWEPPVERSVEFRRTGITRRDARLAFGGEGQPDLPVHFVNDLRWNYYNAGEPARDQLPYSVTWNGVVRGGDAPSDFYVAAAPGTAAMLRIDDGAVVTVDATGTGTASLALAPGWHRVTVTAAGAYGVPRRIEAGFVVDGVRRPFDGRRVLPAPAGSLALAVDAVLRWSLRLLDVGLVAWLAWGVAIRARGDWRERRVGRLLWLGAIVEAVLFALPAADRVIVLSGGNDWLTYEHLARAIPFDPLLIEKGPAAGQGTLFYYQILYPYVVALTHLAFGDGLFGIWFVQRLLLAAGAAWVSLIAARLFGTSVARIALVACGLLLYAKAGRWANVLLAEPVFAPLLAGWTLLLIRAADAPVPARLTAAGIVGGVATLMRSTLLLGWPIVLPVWAAAIRGHRRRAAALLGVALLAVFSLAGIRSWIVTGRVAFLSGNGPVSLLAYNTPPRPLAPAPPARLALYERFDVDPFNQQVVEYAFQDPSSFAANLAGKALYLAGFYDASGLPGEPGTALLFVLTWAAAAAGAVRHVRGARHRPLHEHALVALPGVVALSHFAAHVVFGPNNYGDRMLLPMYPLLVPYAAFGLAPLLSWAAAHAPRVAPLLLAALAIGVVLPPSARTRDLIATLTIAAALLAGAAGVPLRAGRRAWVYVAFAVIVVATYLAERSSDHQDFRHELLLPMAVFAVARLAREPLTRAVTAAALAAAVVIAVGRAGGLALGAAGAPLVWLAAAATAAGMSAMLGRAVAARAVALVAGACVAIALCMPALALAHEELPGRLGDIRRDIRSVIGGSAEAREDLRSDVRVAGVGVLVPLERSYFLLTRAIGVAAAVCLAIMWLQALLAVRHAVRRGAPRILAGCYGALAALLVAGLAGGLLAQDWRAGAWPGMLLAMLFGIAEAGAARVPAPERGAPHV